VASLKDLPARMTAVEAQIVQLRDEMRGGFSAMLSRFEAQDAKIERLFGDIGDISRQMRVLHEDTIERIARLDEGRR